MQQFRVVILDDYDNVVEVKMESPVFEGNDKFERNFSKAQYDELLQLNGEYNLVDYDNAPIMEFQRRQTDSKGNWGKWEYLSDPIVDYYNL